MPDKQYRIQLVSDNSEFEAEGDKDFVLEMVKRFEDRVLKSIKDPLDKLKSPVLDDSEQPLRSISPVEFIRKLKFTKHTDLSLAFGYYLEKFMGVSEFTPADINNLYYESKIERSNTSTACIRNIKRGYMMEPKGSKKGAKNAIC